MYNEETKKIEKSKKEVENYIWHKREVDNLKNQLQAIKQKLHLT